MATNQSEKSMDVENASVGDEQNQQTSKTTLPAKLRMKDRSRSQTNSVSALSTTSTDINDPENLDYEEEDAATSAHNEMDEQPDDIETSFASTEVFVQSKSDKVDSTKQTSKNGEISPVKKERRIAVDKHDDDASKSSFDVQEDEEGEVTNNRKDTVNDSKPTTLTATVASDEGEVDEADLEDGEIHDPAASSKHKHSPPHHQLPEQHRNRTSGGGGNAVPLSPQAKVHCRFFLQGRCHWGANCKYIHPSNDTSKNASGAPNETQSLSNSSDVSPPLSADLVAPQPSPNMWISPQATALAPAFFPNPLIRAPLPPIPTVNVIAASVPGTESAWERGLRSAKTLREQSMRRKQQDKDFNDKKFNLTIRDALDEKEADDNLMNIDRPLPSSIDYDLTVPPLPNYPEQRGYHDRYHPYVHSAHPYFNNNRMNNNNSRHFDSTSSANDHGADRRARHSDDYSDARNANRNRKEKPSTSSSSKDRSLSKRHSSSQHQQQYPSGSHQQHLTDEQLHLNSLANRRADDWHDPWDRSRNHGSGNRRSPLRSSGGGREPSYSSSSASSSSSSRSSRSRSQSSSSSSRSRSRSRPRRRSPSVTRASKPSTTTTVKSSETAKNGSEKKSTSTSKQSNGKKLVSPSTTTNKFLPGRQVSSHTLKKAEKSGHNNSTSHTQSQSTTSKDQRGKDTDVKAKKSLKKEGVSRSGSTSSSSSSDSDANRVTHRSSSSSSDSSSTENEARSSTTKTKTASAGGKPSASTDHSSKSTSRQLSSSSTGGKNASTKSKPDAATTKSSSKSKESSSTTAKKRRDTSSSTGSTNAPKKSKTNSSSSTNPDSHKTTNMKASSSSAANDPSNAENSDSGKKKQKQKILKKLQEVEKLISQRSTKASS